MAPLVDDFPVLLGRERFLACTECAVSGGDGIVADWAEIIEDGAAEIVDINALRH